MSIVYSISTIILFIAIMLVKKSEKKLDVIVTITLSMVLLLCYNTFLCYVFTMCHIPIHLGSLTITNILVVLGLTRKNTL